MFIFIFYCLIIYYKATKSIKSIEYFKSLFVTIYVVFTSINIRIENKLKSNIIYFGFVRKSMMSSTRRTS